jgi:hypothetical protein
MMGNHLAIISLNGITKVLFNTTSELVPANAKVELNRTQNTIINNRIGF